MLNLEQQVFHHLEKSSNILIVFPTHQQSPAKDGDALASALALYLFLKKIGKTVDITTTEKKTSSDPLSFLPSFNQIKNSLQNIRRFIVSVNISQAKIHNIRYTVDNDRLNFIISPKNGWFKPEDVSAKAGDFQYDLIVVIGATDLESLGVLYDDNVEFFYKTTVINIDHQAANEEFGQINYVDVNAVSTTEILFFLLKNFHANILDEEITTCLLAGIIQQTKNFKTANLTPRTLLTTSELIDRGAKREEIVDHLYRSRDINSLKLWGRILNNLKTENNNSLLWSVLSATDFQQTASSPSKLIDLVDELIANVPSAKLVAIIYESGPGETNVSLFSLKNLNALEILREYSPLGTSKNASATTRDDLQSVVKKLVPLLKTSLDKINL